MGEEAALCAFDTCQLSYARGYDTYETRVIQGALDDGFGISWWSGIALTNFGPMG